MEFKLALNYLSLSVKRKLSRVFEIWKTKSIKLNLHGKASKKIRCKKVLRSNFQHFEVTRTEPSPVSVKTIKKNRYYLQKSMLFTTFWKSPDKLKIKPVPVKPIRIKLRSEVLFNSKHLKENNEDVAVVSSKMHFCGTSVYN